MPSNEIDVDVDSFTLCELSGRLATRPETKAFVRLNVIVSAVPLTSKVFQSVVGLSFVDINSDPSSSK
jgi:hypothetical protein